ncbi:MAG TPA: DUF2269 domain-containing protein [Micromonosporaceae bacterium]|nr:DUF2269 domain-containing protein [Micromonosporaceae bacterium]
MMPPWLRRAALTGHVAVSVGWLGAAAAFLVLAVAAVAGAAEPTVRGAYLAMDLINRFALVPLALAAVATGVIQALGTAWGLTRHYWVLAKLAVTVLAAAVLLLQAAPIARLADAAAVGPPGADLREARLSLVVHAAGGVLVLLVPTLLSVVKPRGVTGLGRRRRAGSAQHRGDGVQ